MLHCPSSRINLNNSDIADFERRFAAKQAARLAQVNPNNARLSDGPGRLARLNIVHASDNSSLKKAESCSAAITIDPGDEGESVDSPTPRAGTLSPPTIHTSDYDDDQTVTRSSPAGRRSSSGYSPGVRSPRTDGTAGREGLSPPSLDGVSERQMRPLTTHRTSWLPGPANIVARSPRPVSQQPDFALHLHQDSALVQSQIEAQHLRLWYAQNPSYARRSLLEPSHHTATRRPPSRHTTGTTGTLVPPLNLNPGAPAFVPRTRFGSGTGGSEENNNGGIRILRQGGQATRVSSTQSTSNLRIRSSFERNSQQTYNRRDSRGASNIPTLPLPVIRPGPPQYRRRSHTSDQSSGLPPISSLGERYPALRPPTSIPAPRRNSGSHRQVVFPRRVSSRQHLLDLEHIALPAQLNNDQRRSSTQSKTSSLVVPDAPNIIRASSPTPSSSSRSTPNLLQATSPAPLVHSRSSSLSWDRYVSHRDSGYRVPSMVSAASGISGSSDGRAHQLGHMPFEESILSRGSPLDELLLDFSRLFPDDRPRSVGRSFQRPPGSQTRVSLLSGDIFRQDTSHESENSIRSPANSGRHPLKIANDSSFSEEDAVALSLALPSPNMPSSSPINTSPPHFPTPVATAGEPVNPTPRSSATPSHHSVSSPISEAHTAATPRVQVYNDRMSPRTQPQTPADVSRSTRRARTRATTMSQDEVGAVAGGLFSPVIPERRPHRPYTYPAGTPPSMVDGAAMPARPGIMSGQSGRQSFHVRGEQRSSGTSENEIEGNLAGLDADRRTWMERREEGDLDVTPPAEGRFERYLR